jgi:hypothetical protein
MGVGRRTAWRGVPALRLGVLRAGHGCRGRHYRLGLVFYEWESVGQDWGRRTACVCELTGT